MPGFLSYLRGMETRISRSLTWGSMKFLSYLRGMETRDGVIISESAAKIPILPTRHGNLVSLLYRYNFSAFLSYLRGMETSRSACSLSIRHNIPILPTRHGNLFLYFFCELLIVKFLSYLRGMETPASRHPTLPKSYSYPTYEAWKLDHPIRRLFPLFIPILPTRHGNRTRMIRGYRRF